MQNQDKTHDTSEKVVPLGQEYDHDIMQKHGNVSSTHQSEISKKQSEKVADTQKETDDEKAMEMNRVEVRDIEEEGTQKEKDNEKVMEMNRVEVKKDEEVGPRERLKNHRNEVSGRVWIPEMWGKEDSLKDWIDCSSFDACLVRKDIMSARASMIEEARRNSSTIRVQNS